MQTPYTYASERMASSVSHHMTPHSYISPFLYTVIASAKIQGVALLFIPNMPVL